MTVESLIESPGNVFVESPGGIKNTQFIQEVFSIPFDVTRDRHDCSCGYNLWNMRPVLPDPANHDVSCTGLVTTDPYGHAWIYYFGVELSGTVYTHYPFEVWKDYAGQLNPSNDFDSSGIDKVYDYIKKSPSSAVCNLHTTNNQNIYFKLFRPFTQNFSITALTNVYNNMDWGNLYYLSPYYGGYDRALRNAGNCNDFNDEYFLQPSFTPARNCYLSIYAIALGYALQVVPDQTKAFGNNTGFIFFNDNDLTVNRNLREYIITDLVRALPSVKISNIVSTSTLTLDMKPNGKGVVLGGQVQESLGPNNLIKVPAAVAYLEKDFFTRGYCYSRIFFDSTFKLDSDCTAKIFVTVIEVDRWQVIARKVFSGDSSNGVIYFDNTVDLSAYSPTSDIVLNVVAKFIKKTQKIKYGFKFDRTCNTAQLSFKAPWLTIGKDYGYYDEVDVKIDNVLNAVIFKHQPYPYWEEDETNQVAISVVPMVSNVIRNMLLTDTQNYKTYIPSMCRYKCDIEGTPDETKLPKYYYKDYLYDCTAYNQPRGPFWKESVSKNTEYGFCVDPVHEGYLLLDVDCCVNIQKVGAKYKNIHGVEVINYQGEERTDFSEQWRQNYGRVEYFPGAEFSFTVDTTGFNTLMLEENYPNFTEIPILNVTLT